MSKHNLLNLQEVMKIQLGDFLKNEPHEQQEQEQPEPSEQQEPPEHDQYVCQNPKCRHNERESIHLFEVDGDNMIVICNQCYNSGYRFCLFTHEVLPLDQLEPVLDNMYAQPIYHQNQLTPERLSHINDIYQHLRLIGVDNPDPKHTVVRLRKVN